MSRNSTPKKHKINKGEEDHKSNPLAQSDYPLPFFIDEGKLGIDGNTYYASVKVEDQIVKIDDTVLIIPEKADQLPYLARILRLYKTKKDEMIAKVNWYWRPEELDDSREYILKREIFLSEKTDMIPIDSIKCKIVVYNTASELGANANVPVQVLTSEFFCNRGYLVEKNQFVAINNLMRILRNSECAVNTIEGTSKFDVARARLQLSNNDFIVGREEEQSKLISTIKELVSNNQSGTAFLYGISGTGKTLVVQSVMRKLAKDELAGKFTSFQYFELNCYQLKSNSELFTEMWRLFTGEKINAISAKKAVQDMFLSERSTSYVILLVDEIDALISKQQTVVYELLGLTQNPKSKFIAIIVSNLLNFEVQLEKKNLKILEKNEIRFLPYKDHELVNIINNRVGDLEIFEKRAIELCSKRIAFQRGDARKALEGCLRSLDLKSKNDDIININTMNKALTEISCLQGFGLLNHLSPMQEYLIIAIIIEMKSTKLIQIKMTNIVDRFYKVLAMLQQNQIEVHLILMIAKQLEALKIIKLSNEGSIYPHSLVTLTVGDYIIADYFKKKKEYRKFF